MLELRTVIILVLIHLIYYSILQVFADIVRMGSVKNTPNKLISKLRTDFHINIRTFKKNTNHYGFAWFKTIYLNESLFRNEKALMFTFYHELFHVQNKHKRNTLLLRLVFSLTPITLAFAHWAVFTAIYITMSWSMYKINEIYEKRANNYAKQMTEQ